ncbi:phytoene/squalene synthase family protein [Luteimonas sp. MC1825]|uniref:phytoene/squalene synthase family protein n=1 Tax=Luteimonas sp. MC1825 TaxID=2761107 RepID=UPI001612F3B4|nr:phytoene/squalene synthase family protein [Luteimonas sp. MC1825]MBB6599680.1 phytoene/squalene synthase family protein [Luteimonas sp. MC1825]QOC87366.1 phytoene/squalene synthase family protein [Luteimonas sp. MC1825]
MSIDVRDEAAGFVAKWRTRWPEWALAMVFVPAAQRDVVEAWFSLLQELSDAAWAGSDPTPGLAKLAWWQEELAGWEKGARRHPLGAVLQPCQAPWRALGLALPTLRAMRDQDEHDSLPMASMPADGQAFAEAVAACEAALFAGRTVDAGAVAAVLATLAGEKALLVGAVGAAPIPGATAMTAQPGTRPRGIQLALLRARMAHPERAVPPLRALLAAWRAARRAA